MQQAALSEGERQLLSLCRALVARGGQKQLRVLLCDEPTSHVDYGSDERVVEVLMALPCTLLVNAHRLQHVKQFDRVVLMEGGAVAEMGPPDALLADPESRLSEMWRASEDVSSGEVRV